MKKKIRTSFTISRHGSTEIDVSRRVPRLPRGTPEDPSTDEGIIDRDLQRVSRRNALYLESAQMIARVVFPRYNDRDLRFKSLL